MTVAELRRWLADKKAENVVEVIAHNRAYPFTLITLTQCGGSDDGKDYTSVGFYVDELC